MACATLKRASDWESVNQGPTKRRRCNPFEQSGSTSSKSLAGAETSNDGMSITSAQGPCDRFVKHVQSSAFSNANLSKMSPDQMAQNMRDEIKRLHKRKQLASSAAAIERMQDSESSGSEMGPESRFRPDSPASMVRHPEKALFSFKQVQLICERMLKEREEELREKYDAILNAKLAEQYDAFVRFTYDQIQRRYGSVPSYLS